MPSSIHKSRKKNGSKITHASVPAVPEGSCGKVKADTKAECNYEDGRNIDT